MIISGSRTKQTTNLPYVKMTSPSLILVMAFLAISFAASVIRVLINSLILSMMLALASSSGREGGDLAMIFLKALQELTRADSATRDVSYEFLHEVLRFLHWEHPDYDRSEGRNRSPRVSEMVRTEGMTPTTAARNFASEREIRISTPPRPDVTKLRPAGMA